MNKRLASTAAAGLLLALSGFRSPARAQETAPKPGAAPPIVVLRAARLLDVPGGRYVEHPVVVIRGDRIESVGTDAAGIPAGATVVDLGSRVLLPGLADLHTHVLLQGDATEAEYEVQILQEYPAHRVARAVRALKIALEHGFTTMRDLESSPAITILLD